MYVLRISALEWWTYFLDNVSVLTWELRTNISTDHNIYLTGPESDMQSTAPNQRMAD